ncbi:Ribosomal RNA-processing protein 7 [Penicillium angulare]|uniref:Ribosomal RNA-processing protein 7 n=1 Tax=Penicillium angulare TaxID=116970 RepID=UPI00253FF651|nr:Ribosomal RNA-processing protein 7 [Penicillium angulare]KAJ5273899.1 Ribosomal RNA-processing protein 7 [Penicillium angulare]
MKNSPDIPGYTTLPIQLPSTPLFPKPATHNLYIRPHEPRIPDPDSTRSLFIVNFPIDTTETHIRHLFGAQLSAGRVASVQFEEHQNKKSKSSSAVSTESNLQSSNNKKRKRITSSDLQVTLDNISLPETWNRPLHKSGTHAIVIFADRSSMENSLKAATKASRKQTTLIWGEGIESRIPELGIKRYRTHEKMRYPNRADILRSVNDFMTVFEQVAEAKKREEHRKIGEPDEDGFVTVTHGPKLNSVAREDEAKELLERQKKKGEGLEDFYRFQSREKRKERQNELLRKFDEDKKKLADIKMRKGKIRPE